MAKLKTVLTHTLPLLYTKFLITPFFFFLNVHGKEQERRSGKKTGKKKKLLGLKSRAQL